MKESERIVLNEEEVDSLLERLSVNRLEDSDKKIIAGIIRVYQQIQFALQEAKMSMERLRKLFGFKKTEKRGYLSPPPAEEPKEQADEKDSGSNSQLGTVLDQTLKSLKKVKDALKKEKEAIIEQHRRIAEEKRQ